MKKISIWLLCMVVSILFIGCTSEAEEAANLQKSEGEAINGMTPDQVVVVYETAKIQKNLRRQMLLAGPELLDKVTHGVEDLDFKKDFGPKNNESIKPDYKLKEYKLDDNTFYYEFDKPGEMKLFNYPYKVIRTPQGWKVADDQSEEFRNLYKAKGVTYKGEHLKERGLSDEEIETLRKTRFFVTNIKKAGDPPVHEELIKETLAEDLKAEVIAKEKYKKFYTPTDIKMNGKTPSEYASEALISLVSENYRGFEKYITPKMKADYIDDNPYLPIDWNSSGIADKEPRDLKVIQEAITKDQDYYYEIKYNSYSNKILKVIKTDSGWKIDGLYNNWRRLSDELNLDIKELKFDKNGKEIKSNEWGY